MKKIILTAALFCLPSLASAQWGYGFYPQPFVANPFVYQQPFFYPQPNVSGFSIQTPGFSASSFRSDPTFYLPPPQPSFYNQTFFRHWRW